MVKRPAKIGELETKMLSDLRIREIFEITLSHPQCSNCIRDSSHHFVVNTVWKYKSGESSVCVLWGVLFWKHLIN